MQTGRENWTRRCLGLGRLRAPDVRTLPRMPSASRPPSALPVRAVVGGACAPRGMGAGQWAGLGDLRGAGGCQSTQKYFLERLCLPVFSTFPSVHLYDLCNNTNHKDGGNSTNHTGVDLIQE